MNWFRRLRAWLAAREEAANQKRWDAEQVRRRESMNAENEYRHLQDAEGWPKDNWLM